MLIYFKRSVIAVCAIAVALPIIASTIWPLFTGQMMASTLLGLVLEFALFACGFVLGFAIFNKRANAKADRMIALYNNECDPQAFLKEGQMVISEITFPCNEQGAWFTGYYAQACLEVGRTEEAATLQKGLETSIQAAKKPLVASTIATYLISLLEKTGTADEVEELIDESLARIEHDASAAAGARRDYLNSQLKVVKTRKSGDEQARLRQDESIVQSESYPMRLRVEYAWDEASAAFKMGDADLERASLQFVIAHGGSLALVAHAKDRLSSLA